MNAPVRAQTEQPRLLDPNHASSTLVWLTHIDIGERLGERGTAGTASQASLWSKAKGKPSKELLSVLQVGTRPRFAFGRLFSDRKRRRCSAFAADGYVCFCHHKLQAKTKWRAGRPALRKGSSIGSYNRLFHGAAQPLSRPPNSAST
jgi:hypothetical protein